MPDLRIRTASTMDASSVGALIRELIDDARLAESFQTLATAAVTNPDGERACLIASAGNQLRGAALYGMVAGSEGTARLHLLAGDEVATRALLEALQGELHAHGARLLVAELPELESTTVLLRRLRTSGFEEAGRVRDYYAPGLDLVLLRLALT